MSDVPSNVVDFVQYKNRDPLAFHDRMIRAFVRDVNISVDPQITWVDGFVSLFWQSKQGHLTCILDPRTEGVQVIFERGDEEIDVDGETSLSAQNRWIGYLWDDNNQE